MFLRGPWNALLTLADIQLQGYKIGDGCGKSNILFIITKDSGVITTYYCLHVVVIDTPKNQ